MWPPLKCILMILLYGHYLITNIYLRIALFLLLWAQSKYNLRLYLGLEHFFTIEFQNKDGTVPPRGTQAMLEEDCEWRSWRSGISALIQVSHHNFFSSRYNKIICVKDHSIFMLVLLWFLLIPKLVTDLHGNAYKQQQELSEQQLSRHNGFWHFWQQSCFTAFE